MLQCCFLLQVLLRCAWNGSWNDAPWSPGVELNVLNLDRNLVFLVLGTVPDTVLRSPQCQQGRHLESSRSFRSGGLSTKTSFHSLATARISQMHVDVSWNHIFLDGCTCNYMHILLVICTCTFTQHLTIIYIICNYMHKYTYKYMNK